MQSILFSFTKPVKLNEHFEIPVDETNWETKNYTKVLSKTDKSMKVRDAALQAITKYKINNG